MDIIQAVSNCIKHGHFQEIEGLVEISISIACLCQEARAGICIP
jgi:hypothetical protein